MSGRQFPLKVQKIRDPSFQREVASSRRYFKGMPDRQEQANLCVIREHSLARAWERLMVGILRFRVPGSVFRVWWFPNSTPNLRGQIPSRRPARKSTHQQINASTRKAASKLAHSLQRRASGQANTPQPHFLRPTLCFMTAYCYRYCLLFFNPSLQIQGVPSIFNTEAVSSTVVNSPCRHANSAS